MDLNTLDLNAIAQSDHIQIVVADLALCLADENSVALQVFF